jgi:N-methylhydantoinase B
VAGVLYRDSIELDEVKHPMLFDHCRVVPGSAGAGRRRGGPSCATAYGPRKDPMMVTYASDSTVHAPKGANGGLDGRCSESILHRTDGSTEMLPNLNQIELQPGEIIQQIESSGGGYGDPLEREPERVLRDVVEQYETLERASDVYGVVLVEGTGDGGLAVDEAATAARRAELRQ